MSAIESAFVNTILDRENQGYKGWDSGTGRTSEVIQKTCAQQDTTARKTFGLRMWMSKNAAQGKFECVFLVYRRCFLPSITSNKS